MLTNGQVAGLKKEQATELVDELEAARARHKRQLDHSTGPPHGRAASYSSATTSKDTMGDPDIQGMESAFGTPSPRANGSRTRHGAGCRIRSAGTPASTGLSYFARLADPMTESFRTRKAGPSSFLASRLT